MVDVIIDGEAAYCLPDCTCCTACHKLITEVDECPFPEPYGLWSDKYRCSPDCNYYQEIWEDEELKKELALDEDKTLLEPLEET